MSGTAVIGLKAITTNAQLQDYVSSPTLSQTCPTEHDGRYLLARLYSDDPTMNWCRALDQNLVIRVVSRNYGTDSSSNDTAEADPVIDIGLPTPKALYDIVWGLLPSFVQARVTQWAKSNMDGPIANEITDYVKGALGLLPIPVPSFFVNAVANLVIPPLVAYIISTLASSSTNQTSNTATMLASRFAFPHHTAKSLKVLKKLDRRILLAAGLKPLHLPPHLILTASNNSAADSDAGSDADSDAADDTPACLGQPDGRDSHVDMEQFYQCDIPNGCKPLQLTQVIAAQIRTNPKSDPDTDTFASAVWKSLTSDTKTQLRADVNASPPNRADIADTLYTPTRDLLKKDPYDVPSPILDSFTAMKVPEVTEWVITTQS